jgi:Fic family protein
VKRGETGDRRVVSSAGREVVRAFIPAPLPPTPPLALDPELWRQIETALVALGRLDSLSLLLPDPHLFHRTFARKEALLSSQIDGTRATLTDLRLHELGANPGVPVDEIREVANLVRALEHGVQQLREGTPFDNRLLREVHSVLLESERGSQRDPGRFRRSQNWVRGSRPANARFVPPPPEEVETCMADLEGFLQGPGDGTTVLVRAALAHAQFETIHPFLEGNGRLGRLLIPLLLCAEGVLRGPLLHLSLYLKQHRLEYYRLLQEVRDEGDWEAWVAFFVTGVIETAERAMSTAQQLVTLFRSDRERIQGALGRATSSALRVHVSLQERPIQTSAQLAADTGLTVPTVNAALARLGPEGLRLVSELTGQRRDRIYRYDGHLGILGEGTEAS